MDNKKVNENIIEGRNAVLEAFRSGKPVDKLYVLDGCQDGPVRTIVREARKHDTIIQFVEKERLAQLSETGRHQGVIAYAAAYEYSEVSDMLELARERGEDPFIILLDNIEDPHNLGAIIRTANLAGAHGVIIPKRRAVGLTATVAKTSAGAINYTPVAKVTNLTKTMKELKEEGGILARSKRYRDNNREIIKRFKKMGFKTYIDEVHQGPIITTFLFPEDCNFTFEEMYDYIKERGYAIYPGKVTEAATFRIGNIGEIYKEDVEKLCGIMSEFLEAR